MLKKLSDGTLVKTRPLTIGLQSELARKHKEPPVPKREIHIEKTGVTEMVDVVPGEPEWEEWMEECEKLALKFAEDLIALAVDYGVVAWTKNRILIWLIEKGLPLDWLMHKDKPWWWRFTRTNRTLSAHGLEVGKSRASYIRNVVLGNTADFACVRDAILDKTAPITEQEVAAVESSFQD